MTKTSRKERNLLRFSNSRPYFVIFAFFVVDLPF
jgi:hypothetical protein